MAHDDTVERLLRGGPRVRSRAVSELRLAIGGGETVDLPDPDEAPADMRPAVLDLLRLQRLCEEDWEAVRAAWDEGDDRRSALLAYGSSRTYHPCLLEHAISCLEDDDVELVAAAYGALGTFLRTAPQPADAILELVDAAVYDKRRTKAKALSTLGAINRNSILLAAERPVVRPMLERHYRPRLAAKKAADRTFATEVMTHAAIRAGDIDGLTTLSRLSDRTVSTAFRRRFKFDNVVAAKQVLLEVRDHPLDVKQAFAEAVRLGMEPKAKETNVVATARASVFEAAPVRRREAIATLTSALSAEMADIRTAAPHLGLSLFDEDPQVKSEATLAVYTLCDLQGSVWIVRALSPLIEAALEDRSGEAGEQLRSALARMPGRT